jgi:type II secretory pathway pseudopilin PulG
MVNRRYVNPFIRFFRDRFIRNQRGDILLEVLIAIAILGLVGVAVLTGFSTSFRAIGVLDKKEIARNLAQNQIEYVDKLAYQYDANTYPANPEMYIPDGWSVLPVVVQPVHALDDGIQKVSVTVRWQEEDVYTLTVYKLDL